MNTTEKYEHINDLVTKFQNGDDSAFSELIELYKNMIFFIAKSYYRLCRCKLRDFLNDLKSQFFIYLKDYDKSRGVFFTAYISIKLTMYAKSLLVDRQRYEKHFVLVAPLGNMSDILNVAHYKAERQQDCTDILELAHIILRDKEYQIFYLYYYEGLTRKEISQRLNIPFNSINFSQINRQLKRIVNNDYIKTV